MGVLGVILRHISHASHVLLVVWCVYVTITSHDPGDTRHGGMAGPWTTLGLDACFVLALQTHRPCVQSANAESHEAVCGR